MDVPSDRVAHDRADERHGTHDDTSAMAALRASEDRQRFLLALGDRMRSARDAAEVLELSTRMLGERLNASRVVYVEIDEKGNRAILREGWAAQGAPPHPAELRLSDFAGPLIQELRAGNTIRVDDIGVAPYARSDLAALADIGIRAMVSVPLIVNEQLVMTLNVHSASARAWTGSEVELIRQVAERTWADVERARAQEALRVSNESFRYLVEHSPFGVYAVDADFRLVQVSAGAQKVFASVRPLLDRDFADVLRILWPEPFATEAINLFRHTLATGEPYHAPSTVERRADIQEVESYDWKIERVTLPDGRYGVVCHFYDLSERQRYEAELREARLQAENANRAKTEFLAVMSHELRTPLNAIGGYAELLDMGIRGPVTSEQREDLRRLQSSQRHLLGLINEVLNYAKLETGSVHFVMHDLRVCDVVRDAELLIAPQARARGLELVVQECPPELEVHADAEKLRQVLVNLLSNAIKFTNPGGRIELRVAESPDALRIIVRDNGIGIEAEHLERIFEPFVQVRSDFTRPHEGTGLGLAISRDLARGMGGDLAAESATGTGSTFTLTLVPTKSAR